MVQKRVLLKLELRQYNETLASPDYKTTSQLVGRQPELRSHGSTELRKIGFALLRQDYKTTSRAAAGIADLRNYGIMEASPRQRVERSLPTAKGQQLTVVRQPLVDLWSCRLAVCEATAEPAHCS